jgi:hypothetical protein
MVRGTHPVQGGVTICFPGHERIYLDCPARNVLCIWSQDKDFRARVLITRVAFALSQSSIAHGQSS